MGELGLLFAHHSVPMIVYNHCPGSLLRELTGKVNKKYPYPADEKDVQLLRVPNTGTALVKLLCHRTSRFYFDGVHLSWGPGDSGAYFGLYLNELSREPRPVLWKTWEYAWQDLCKNASGHVVPHDYDGIVFYHQNIVIESTPPFAVVVQI